LVRENTKLGEAIATAIRPANTRMRAVCRSDSCG
jgi:ferredoxin